MIIVVNKKNHKPCPINLVGSVDVYVGRPSPLGNPFAMRTESDRAMVIAQYEEWLNKSTHISDVKSALDMIRVLHMQGTHVHLVCWCAPSACHADVIKRKIEEMK